MDGATTGRASSATASALMALVALGIVAYGCVLVDWPNLALWATSPKEDKES